MSPFCIHSLRTPLYLKNVYVTVPGSLYQVISPTLELIFFTVPFLGFAKKNDVTFLHTLTSHPPLPEKHLFYGSLLLHQVVSSTLKLIFFTIPFLYLAKRSVINFLNTITTCRTKSLFFNGSNKKRRRLL